MPLAVSAIRASIGETAGMLLIAAAFLADAVAVAGLIYVKKKKIALSYKGQNDSGKTSK